jgi:ribonuclease P protein component
VAIYRFRKQERLTRKTEIAKLFDRNSQDGHVKAYPFIFTWKEEPLNADVPAQILFVVSKKNFSRAHDRARIKRQMREHYRYRKAELYTLLNSYGKQIILAGIYTGKAHEPPNRLTKQFDKAFQRLTKGIERSFQQASDSPDQAL